MRRTDRTAFPTEDRELQRWWDEMQRSLIAQARGVYGAALNNGIAKEVARKILPEGLTNSRMYMNGTLRSWMHYVDIRCDEATQKEHREVADQCKDILTDLFPSHLWREQMENKQYYHFKKELLTEA
jgi:thymidylate synthase (FAD)